eukprot:TRINITY_DN6997_c0_g1_i11.p1 TRINITY_DN6997_c0_g1~~TRINITY_DN6997_c0_g1_i11.p1  ORF type:complete len:100 (-),score=7.93 TRINITY_DN6997_c0_g1_i11:599-898(-)
MKKGANEILETRVIFNNLLRQSTSFFGGRGGALDENLLAPSSLNNFIICSILLFIYLHWAQVIQKISLKFLQHESRWWFIKPKSMSFFPYVPWDILFQE